MKILVLWALLAVSVSVFGGCAANDLVVKRQTETESKVEHLFQLTGGQEARLNELTGRLAVLEEQEARRAQLLQELSNGIRELKDINQALQARVQDTVAPATPKIELVNPEPTYKGREGGPPPFYVRAFGLYSSNNFTAAIEAFEQFMKQEPGSEYVPNAHYWIGECYYSSSDLNRALVSFQKVIDGWPRHAKAPDALLKIGYSHLALKQQDKAKSSFEQVVRAYPGSPAAAKARERLNSILPSGTETR